MSEQMERTEEQVDLPPRDESAVKPSKFALEEKWGQDAPDSAPDGVGDRNANESQPTEQAVQDEAAEVIEKLARERDDYLDHLKRLQAEFDNYRRRVQREKSEMTEFLLQGFILELLQVVDSLSRALQSADGSADTASYRQGVEMVHKQLMSVLENRGLKKIDAVGQPFDPNLHEAIGQVATGEHEPGTVVNELTTGYTLKERVILAPKVQIAVKPPDDAAQPEA